MLERLTIFINLMMSGSKVSSDTSVLPGRILSHFHRIHGFDCVLEYIEDYPRVCLYYPRRRNYALRPFCEYIDRTQHYDIDWTPYATHQNTIHFDPISYYSGWLACESNLMYMYMPERCMRQFRFGQIIPRAPLMVALISIVRRHLDDLLASYESYLTPDAPGRQPRPAHEEILENEQGMDDHAVNVLPICQNIMRITRDGIK
ncbi:uncharacterized protein LOC131613668 [Vicia villosa]|uniref:uncharacterized protein LOC131613668 n=1 Tax=Vicia villosa TaxID=3911 RepID=UPI00273BD883|nr:uncharacterized protein LOC131613668 [Vicia villosa]